MEIVVSSQYLKTPFQCDGLNILLSHHTPKAIGQSSNELCKKILKYFCALWTCVLEYETQPKLEHNDDFVPTRRRDVKSTYHCLNSRSFSLSHSHSLSLPLAQALFLSAFLQSSQTLLTSKFDFSLPTERVQRFHTSPPPPPPPNGLGHDDVPVWRDRCDVHRKRPLWRCLDEPDMDFRPNSKCNYYRKILRTTQSEQLLLKKWQRWKKKTSSLQRSCVSLSCCHEGRALQNRFDTVPRYQL